MFAMALSLSGFAGLGLDLAISHTWGLQWRLTHDSSPWVGMMAAALDDESCVAALLTRGAINTCGFQDRTIITLVD
jgi:hypothetical protein